MAQSTSKAGKDSISPAQCRAARALLGWAQSDLAEASGLPVTVIARFETEVTMPRRSSFGALIAAFTKAGIVFMHAEAAQGVLLFERRPR
jgi:predicted transcriptional regulator